MALSPDREVQENLEMLFMDLIAMMDQMKHYKDVALEDTPNIHPKFASNVNLMNGNVKIIFNVLM